MALNRSCARQSLRRRHFGSFVILSLSIFYNLLAIPSFFIQVTAARVVRITRRGHFFLYRETSFYQEPIPTYYHLWRPIILILEGPVFLISPRPVFIRIRNQLFLSGENAATGQCGYSHWMPLFEPELMYSVKYAPDKGLMLQQLSSLKFYPQPLVAFIA